jgi:uncharacterized protein YggE
MNNKMSLTLDFRVISAVLLVIIAVMLGFWQPWEDTSVKRTITVTGTGKVTAEPDYYQFNPTYSKSTTAELNTHITDVTKKLKELGVADKDILLQSSAYDTPKVSSDASLIAPAPPETDSNVAYLTIKVTGKELAQKVQDYIATTEAEGQLTPYPMFSDDKQKELKNQAREKAIADAKDQAQKTAEGVGAKVGKATEIKDTDDGYGFPLLESGSTADAMTVSASLPIYPGEQDVTFTIQATFEIK